MADAFHLAGFEVSREPGRAGDGPQTVCPLTLPVPVPPGVGCDHARPLRGGSQAGRVPRRGLRGRLQLRRRPGLCQRSARALPTSSPHVPEAGPWPLTSTRPGEMPHLNVAGGQAGQCHLGWRARALSDLRQVVLWESWLSPSVFFVCLFFLREARNPDFHTKSYF